MKVAERGVPLLDILIPGSPTPAERDAAGELKASLDRVTGAAFRVVSENETPVQRFISIGRTRAAESAGLVTAAGPADGEGIAIRVHDGNVFLVGEGPSVVDAAMAFLEEDIGVRWYSHQWEYAPRDADLAVEVVSRTSRPAFGRRMVFTASVLSSDAAWTRHNRVMKWNRFDHIDGWFCHTYAKICPMSEFNSRPELFAQDRQGKPFNTQLCPTHPEVVRLAKEAVLEALRKQHREGRFISISENDGSTGYCRCDRCETINRAHGAPIAAHLTLVNEVARTIAGEFPDHQVTFLVYSKDYRRPPTRMRMEPNVAMWFCTNDVDKQKAYPTASTAERSFQRWRKVVDHVYTWDYSCDYSNYFRVLPSLPAKIANLRHWAENGVQGIMFLEVFGCYGGDQQALRAWILSKLLWNPALDTDELARDFCQGVFGEAAEEMFEYYKLTEKAGLSGQTVEEAYGHEGFTAAATALFDRAFAKADAAGDEELRRRIEVHYAPTAVMELDRWFDGFPGNSAALPVERYRSLLETVVRITDREGMNRYSELRTMAGRLAEWRMLAESAETGVLRVNAVDATLYEYPQREDPLGATGKVCRLPNNDAWLVQWHFPTNLCKPGRAYQLRARLRKESDAGSGPVAVVGVHDAKRPDKSFLRRLDNSDLETEAYTWIEVGDPFVPLKGQFAWFAVNAGSAIGGMFVDQIELASVPMGRRIRTDDVVKNDE